MDNNNRESRTEIQEQLKNIGIQIDALAQSTMIKEIVLMFAYTKQFKEAEQIIIWFRSKLQDNDLEEIKSHIIKTYNYELQLDA